MKSLTTLIISAILAVWIMAIAILSVQNATPVTLKFLAYESIRLPVGVVLAFSAAGGAIVGAIIAIPLFTPSSTTFDDFPADNYETENPPQQTTVGANDWMETGSKDW
jgi:uncharacterized integral membrane protein